MIIWADLQGGGDVLFLCCLQGFLFSIHLKYQTFCNSRKMLFTIWEKFRCSSSDHCSISKCQPTNMTTSSLRLTMSRPSQDSHLEAWVKKLNSWISCDTKILAIYDIYWKIKHWIGLLTPQSLDLSEYECQKIIPHSKIILLAFICFTN